MHNVVFVGGSQFVICVYVQIYLYDINTLLQPLLRPRQLLPYAIVTYTVDGIQQDVAEVEPLPSDVPPELRHIIERINAKAEGHASISAQRPFLENFSRISSVVGADSAQSSTTTVASTIAVIGSGNAGRMDVPAESSDAHLQRVIAQINARLESQERSRQLALQNVAVMGAAAVLPSVSQSEVYPSAGRRVVSRNISDQVATGLSVLVSSAPRVDGGSLAITAITAASGASLTGYSGSLPTVAAAQPKLTVPAANMAATGGAYVALAASGRSAPFAVAPELVAGSSTLAGMQYSSSAAPYLRTLPGVVDATGIAAAVDPATVVASQQIKYIPCQSGGRGDMSVVGAASTGGLYPLQSVMPSDTVGAGYTLINSGAAVKRPLNDVMLYMVDKRPRYY